MAKRFWEPAKSTVEKAPNRLQVSHEQPGVMSRPHWHAQVEVNYVFQRRRALPDARTYLAA